MPEATSNRRTRGAESDAPVKRELEAAPLLLRKASLILLVGALFPWLTSMATNGAMPWAQWGIGLVCTLVAGFVLIESAKVNSGLEANGLVKPIAGAHPMAGTIFALVVFIAGVAVNFTAPTEAELYGFMAGLESGTLLLALATYAHILRYEYGGKFNPIFPLMFAGPAIAGTMQAIKAATQMGNHGLVIVSLLGSLIVAGGGFYAMYTMFVSMKQAKIEGDIKKAQERERRKQERAARRAQGE